MVDYAPEGANPPYILMVCDMKLRIRVYKDYYQISCNSEKDAKDLEGKLKARIIAAKDAEVLNRDGHFLLQLSKEIPAPLIKQVLENILKDTSSNKVEVVFEYSKDYFEFILILVSAAL